MKTSIEFIKGVKETSIPIIKLTKSKNGQTGTATFLFFKPKIFEISISCFSYLEGLYLTWEEKSIYTNDIKILFKFGKPFLVKAIFIFKNSLDWYKFLNFMRNFSNETGLLFSETENSETENI